MQSDGPARAFESKPACHAACLYLLYYHCAPAVRAHYSQSKCGLRVHE